MPHLTLSLLGGFEALLDGQPITAFDTDKTRALLAYLAVEAGHAHRRAELAGLLWPDLPEKKAAHNLSQTLLRLRRALREDVPPVHAARQPFVLCTSQEIRFNPLSDYQLDVARFEELLKARQEHQHVHAPTCHVCLQWLQQAAALYRGDLLAGFSLRDSMPFEEWLLLEQESLHGQALAALAQLAGYYEQHGVHEQVLHHARQLAALEPWHEQAQLQLMRAFALSGQAATALDQYEFYRRTLAAEFGIEPSAEATALYRQIQTGAIRPAREAQAGMRTVGGAAPAAGKERRQITALICGRKAPLDREDPEALYEQLTRCRRHCEGILSRYGGQRGYCQGDECLIYFGYPQTQEDAARRAVHAAQAMIAAQPEDAPIAIGIHTDWMVVSGERASASELVGAAPTLARGCQRLAGPGEVALTTETKRLVHDWFDCETLGHHTWPGLAEPVALYRVSGTRSAQNRLDWFAQAHRLSPYIGREQELAQLDACRIAAQQGRGRVVTLRGEPGIGKSRLVWELKQSMPASVAWLESHCSPYYRNTSLYPVIGLLEQICGFATDDDPHVRRDKVAGALARFDLAHPATVWLLSLLLGLPTEAPAPPTITAEQRERLRELFVALLQRQAAAQPTVLVIEDLHWSDPTTSAWLERSFDALAAVPCLVLLTFRPTFVPAWLPRPHLTPITLGPLSPDQAECMVAHLTGDTTLGDETRRRIVAQTDGIPLFVEELTKSLLEAGVSAPAGSETPRALSEIPATLRDSLLARLDRVGVARETASWAAVLGREFPYAILRAAAPFDEQRLQDDLAVLVAAELIHPQGQARQATYVFKHTLIQEAAYTSLLKRTRQKYHRRIAETLAASFPQIAQTQPEVLAQHYAQAGLPAQAADHWLAAGERATSQGATREARTFFDRALELIEPADHAQRWRALWGREAVLHLLGDQAAQQADVAALLALAETMDDDTRRSRAYLQQARYAAGQDDNQAMLHAAEAAIGAARRAGNVTLEVRALTGKVQALTDSGEHAAAQRAADETIVRAQGIEDEAARNAALGDVAYFYLEAGDLVRGLELMSRAAEAAQQTGDRRKASQCDVNIGFTLAQLGLYAPARATLEAGLALAEATGDRRLQARHTINLGFVHWRSGDRDTARQLVEQALGEFKATGDAYGQAACLAYLGFIREEAEDWDAAAEYLAQARAGFARIGVDSDRIEAQAAAARCALAQGRREEAHRLALEVWDDVCEHGIAALDSPSRVCLHLAAVLAVTGLPDSHVSPHQVREAGYRALMELADKLSNPEWRRSFLENVPANRAIVAWRQRLQEND